MAVRLGEAVVYLLGESKDLDEDLKGAEKKTENWAKGLAKNVSGLLGNVLKVGLAGVAGGVVAVTAGLAAAGKAAAEEEQGIARLGAAVKASGADWDEARGAIEDYLAAELKRTALDDGAGREAISRLTQATGDYRRALELMPLAQDLARAKGMDLATASEIVGKVAAGNTGILSRYGIVLEKGASAQEALAEMQSRFAGQAEAYGNTAAGAQEKLDIALGNLKETIGGAVLPIIASLASKMADWAMRIMPIVEAAAARLGPILQNIIGVIGGLVDVFILGQEPMGDWSTMWQTLASLFGEEMATKIADAVVWIQNLATTIGAFVTETVIPFVTQHAEAFKGALIAIGAVLAGAAIVSGVLAIAGAIAALANPLTAIILVVALLGAAWSSNFGGIQEKTAAVLAWVQGAFQAFIAFVQPLIQGFLVLLSGWWSAHGAEVMGAVSAMWTFIQNVIQTAISVIQSVVSTFLALVKQWWTEHKEQVLSLVNTLWEMVKNIFSTVTGVIENLFLAFTALLRGDWDALGTYLKTAWELLWNGIKTHAELVWELIKGAIELWIGTIKTVWNFFKEDLEKLWNDLWEAVQKTFNTAKESLITGVKNLVRDAIKTITDAWGDFVGMGESIIMGMLQGIKNKAKDLANAVAQAARKALDKAKAALGIKSPSTEFYQVAVDVVRGFVTGVEDNAGQIDDVVETAFVSPIDRTKRAWELALGDMARITKEGMGGLGELVSGGLVTPNVPAPPLSQTSTAIETRGLSNIMPGLGKSAIGALKKLVQTTAQTTGAGGVGRGTGIVGLWGDAMDDIADKTEKTFSKTPPGVLATITNGLRDILARTDTALNGPAPSLNQIWKDALGDLTEQVDGAFDPSNPHGIVGRIDTGLETIIRKVDETGESFGGLKNSMNGIIIPDWLEGHSPPPLANWLSEIAEAATMLDRPLGGVGEGLGRGMDGAGGPAGRAAGAVDLVATNGLLGQILANLRALVAGVQALQPAPVVDSRTLARQLEFEARAGR